MRRLLVCLLVFVGVLLSLPVASPLHTQANLHAAQTPTPITVYITKTGEKYHRDTCRYLSKSKIATTLKEARARGFSPCKVCKPSAH